MPKPIIHGFDHAEGGADPVPGKSGYIHWEGDGSDWNSGVPADDDNHGDYVVIASAGAHTGSFFGASIEIVATSDAAGGVYVADSSGQGITVLVDGSIFPNGVLTLEAEADTGGILLQNNSTVADANIVLNSTDNSIVLNARSVAAPTPPAGDIYIVADTQIDIISYGTGLNIESLGAGILLNAASAVGASYPGSSTRPIVLVSKGAAASDPAVMVGLDSGDMFYIFQNSAVGGTRIFSASTNGVVMNFLPTVNPGIAGHVWNNGGVLNIV